MLVLLFILFYILVLLYTQSFLLFISGILLFGILFQYGEHFGNPLSNIGIELQQLQGGCQGITQEGFQSTTARDKILNPLTLNPLLKYEFNTSNKRNPLNNVLLTDIHDNPDKKPAPPAFNTKVVDDINKASMNLVQTLNPTIKNTTKQLYGSLWDQFEFDKSMWYYYSNPNTKIPNDQGAYAKFLYGSMPSCRGGDSAACVQDNQRYNLY